MAMGKEETLGDTGVSQDRVIQFLTETEEAADDVLLDRQSLIGLDKKRQSLREALRCVLYSEDTSLESPHEFEIKHVDNL